MTRENESPSTEPRPINLTQHVEDGWDDAIVLLRAYFAGPLGTGKGFTGGYWDTFDPTGDRASTAHLLTATDLLSSSLLSAPIHAETVIALLGEKRDEITRQLNLMGEDRDLVDLSAGEVRELERGNKLWDTLRSVRYIGRTRASKLIARKRPRLIPIYDDVVGRAVYGNTANHQWQRLHARLTADDGSLHERLQRLHRDAGLPAAVTPLRVLDVLTWLDGSGQASELLASR